MSQIRATSGVAGADTLRQHFTHRPLGLETARNLMRASGEEPHEIDAFLQDPPEAWEEVIEKVSDPKEAMNALCVLRLADAERKAGLSFMDLPYGPRVIQLCLDEADQTETVSTAAGMLWPSQGFKVMLASNDPKAGFVAKVTEALRNGYPLLVLSRQRNGVPAEVEALIETTLVIGRPTRDMILTVLEKLHLQADPVPTDVAALLPDDAALAGLKSIHFAMAFGARSPAAIATRLQDLTKLGASGGDQVTAPGLEHVFGQPHAVSFLQGLSADVTSWQQGQLDWAEVTSSALFYGPPGTGKTMLARAFASTAGLPIIASSYAECQKAGHQGQMLAALDKAFSDAMSRAPSVLFIDEIDAFYDRGTGNGTFDKYNVGVVNGLLTMIDTLRRCPGVVLLAATNHIEHVDPAVIRSGRFDVKLPIQPLSREAICAQLAAAVKEVEGGTAAALTALADRLLGQSGAEIANTIRAARTQSRHEKTLWGIEALQRYIGTTLPPTAPDRLRRIAVHEAGHLLAGHLLGCPAAERVMIGETGGYVRRPHRDFYLEADVAADLTMLLAGRAAEQLVFGAVSSGAGSGPQSDLAQATRLATEAEAQWQLSGAPEPWSAAPHMTADLRQTVQARLMEADRKAIELLQNHRSVLEAIAEELLARREIDAPELQQLILSTLEGTSPHRNPAV